MKIENSSVVHPKLFFPDPDPALTLISDPACLWKNIRNSDDLSIAKKPDCSEKFIRTADHLDIAKKLIFLKSEHFYSFVLRT
jgi:hypothetical protein